MKKIPLEIETKLTALINLGVEKGAEVLNTLLNSLVNLSVPYIKVIPFEELVQNPEVNTSEILSAVEMSYKGDINGNSELIFTNENAKKLIQAFTEGESLPPDEESYKSGILCEIGNIVINAVMGKISNTLQLNFRYSVPSYIEGKAEKIYKPLENIESPVILLAKTRFNIQELSLEGDLAIFFTLSTFDELLAKLDTMDKQKGEHF